MCDTSEKICIGFIGLGLIGGSLQKPSERFTRGIN